MQPAITRGSFVKRLQLTLPHSPFCAVYRRGRVSRVLKEPEPATIDVMQAINPEGVGLISHYKPLNGHSTNARIVYMHADVEKVLFTQDEIRARVAELGRLIAHDYREGDLVMLGVLKGAFVFTADLIRQTQPVPASFEVDFIKASSYGSGTDSSGDVKLGDGQVIARMKGRDVLLVEDIVDTGLTLQKLLDVLKAAGARSVKICTLLNKQERRQSPIQPDYVGFECPNEFVIGYGLDFDEKYRWLPYIGVLKPECYQ